MNRFKPISLPVLPHTTDLAERLKQTLPAPENAVPAPAPLHSSLLPMDKNSLREKIVAAIKTVFDPEIPVNIYELGLVYAIDIHPDQSVDIRMTLTSPGCPVAGELPLQVQSKVQNIPQVTSANVELVWDPPWNQLMMSEAARLELGL